MGSRNGRQRKACPLWPSSVQLVEMFPFPDGVNLTLQESGVEEVIALLDVYQIRHQAEGGARSCSL